MRRVKQYFNKIRGKLARSGGFSFTELLAATIILLIAAEGMAQGISFASHNFRSQMKNSESRILFSTLRETINYELSQIGNEKAGGKLKYSGVSGNRYTISDFHSVSFALEGTKINTSFAAIDASGNVVESGGGYVALGEIKADKFSGKKIASEAVYTYGCTARVDDFVYVENTETPSYFEYKLTVFDGDGNVMITDTIQVMPSDADKVELSAS